MKNNCKKKMLFENNSLPAEAPAIFYQETKKNKDYLF